MGLFGKLKEAIERIRRPKIGEAQATRYPISQGINIRRAPDEYIEGVIAPPSVQLDGNRSALISSIKYENTVYNAQGGRNHIMVATLNLLEQGNAGVLGASAASRKVVFEIPATGEPIDSKTVAWNIANHYMQASNEAPNQDEIYYVGELGNGQYDSSKRINYEGYNYFKRVLEPRLSSEKQNDNDNRDRTNEAIIRNGEMNTRQHEGDLYRQSYEKAREEASIRQRDRQNFYIAPKSNPYYENDGFGHEGRLCQDFAGISAYNGNTLRINRVCEAYQDAYGRHLYTAYIQSTYDGKEAERLNRGSTPAGIPVCFALDKTMYEIINSNNPQEIYSLSKLFSQVDISRANMNDTMNYIGAMDYKGNLVPANTNSIELNNKIQELSNEAFQRKSQRAQGWER